jgi:glycerol-3-phosphate dehydrogenase
MPVRAGVGKKIYFTLLDAFFETYDRYQPLKRGKPHAVLSADDVRRLEPGLAGDLVGAMSWDEWGIDGARLCVANAVDAEERGAKLFIGCTRWRRSSGARARGSRWPCATATGHTGQAGRLTTTAVVNATGAWSPITASLAGMRPIHARVRPGKGIHVVYDRRVTNYAISASAIDGRQIFVEPWQNMTIVGTTDDDYYGDLDDVCATSEEVRYLVQGVARVLPAIRGARVIGTYAGVRPTLHAFGKNEDALSRDHLVIDHAPHGAPNMYSMIGGKLASYRLFSEEMVDVLSQRFDLGVHGATHTTPLPGGDREVDPFAFAQRAGIDAVAATRIVYRHGSRAERIEERIARRRREAATVCVCEPVIEAEIRYVAQSERPRTVADVARRTRLGLGACGGMRCAARCGQILAEELGLPPREGLGQAVRFLTQKARTRAVGLGPEQARQEAFAIASVRAELGLGADDDELGTGGSGT